MTKPPTPDTTALGVRKRMLLFYVGSGTDWQRAGVTGETVTALIVRGLIVRDRDGRLRRECRRRADSGCRAPP